MKRINVISSSIKSVGYDANDQVLEIEFVRGAIYQYQQVHYEDVIDLIFAESVGKYFSQYIKNNYKFEKIK
jgi:hypothetical protein